MTLPPKKKRERSGIERGPQRVWPRHRKFLRSHQCVVRRCQLSPIEVSHVRTAANSGTGLKPPDWDAVPMCRLHHQIYHNIGHCSFEAETGLDLKRLARKMAAKSPDLKMKEAMRNAMITTQLWVILWRMK